MKKSLTEENSRAIQRGLQSIADCKKDADDYIEACSFTGEIYPYDCLEIAKRLADQKRGHDALIWLERMGTPENLLWEGQYIDLKIHALELEDRYNAAQEERLSWFEKSLDVETYGNILKNAEEGFKKSFRSEAIEKAFQFRDPHRVLDFLMNIQEIEALSRYVRLKYNQLHGQLYQYLRPTAEVLKDVDLVASTLLYRKMIQHILEGAQSKQYKYAIKDLLTCEALSDKIEDWDSVQPHTLYFKEMEESHKRKYRFWMDYEKITHRRGVQKKEVSSDVI